MFSGSTKASECESCGKVFSQTVPTSVIPFALVVIAAFTGWGTFLEPLLTSTLIAIGFSLLLSIGSLTGFLWGLTVLQNYGIKNGRCPRCSGTLQHRNAGFIETARPTGSELIIDLLVIGLPFILILVSHVFSKLMNL